VSGPPAPAHLAVVPVVGLDQQAEHALEYAGRLAPQVLAVHVREAGDGRTREFEDAWAKRAPAVPLMILDGSAGGWERPFLKALDALRRSARADLITVVVPPPSSGALQLALGRQPGVVVRGLPADDSPPD
jgi:hypothetical protein